jgi:hypothetical protein
MEIALGERNLHAVSLELADNFTIDIRAHQEMSSRVFDPNPKPHVPGRVAKAPMQHIGSGVFEHLWVFLGHLF